MKSMKGILVLIATLTNLPAGTAQTEVGMVPLVSAVQDPQPAQPPTPAPRDPPPPPPRARPQPPSEPEEASPQHESSAGQWVYTDQYGWVWMPYGDEFTNVPPGGSTPNMYVYYPEGGWCWVIAPWLWGWGSMPYFGLLGPRYFGWYGHGLGHWYGFADRYGHRGWSGRGYSSGGRWNGVGHIQAAPSRGGHFTASRGGHFSAPRGGNFAAPRGGFRGGGGSTRGSGHGGHR